MVQLPGVNIAFQNGLLGTVIPSEDGVCAYISENLPDGVYYQPDAQGVLTEFFNNAGTGAELHNRLCNGEDEDYVAKAKAVIADTHGRVRIIGIDTTLTAAQLTEIRNYSLAMHAPVVIICQADTSAATQPQADGAAVTDISLLALLGRIAAVPVERHIGRVRDGALVLSDEPNDIVESGLHAKLEAGIITLRQFAGRDGFFIANDDMCVEATDDYRSLARRRVADKAYRIAYDTLLNYVNDNLPVNNDGTITAAAAKAVEQTLITAIYNQMTAEGNLSVDEENSSDKGVKASVDTTNDFVGTSKLNVTISIKPYGYAKYIDVKLGFLKE
ncbi:MAG: hypothetical protein IJT12_03985 [Paludibacteraceae bacterium]|nr:hypothetical protein [Paludibacteraceae bacterium]